jgi:hypothetical protein
VHLDDGVVQNFTFRALRGHGFSYVDDLIEGILRMMQAEDRVTEPTSIGVPEP